LTSAIITPTRSYGNNDLNEYLKVNEAKLVIDDVGSVLGCGIAGLGAALEH
jgi:hypothetical protein